MHVLQLIRRHFIKLLISVTVVSAVGGWIVSRQSNTNVDAHMTSPGEVPYPQLSTNDVVVGLDLPRVDVLTENGTTISSSRWVGSPLVINFWYSTCEPCRREMPLLAQTAQRFGRDVRFIGVNLNDSPTVARSFADRYGVTYDLVFDRDGNLARQLGVATAPVTLFVSADGVILDQVAGELKEADLTSRLNRWFSL